MILRNFNSFHPRIIPMQRILSEDTWQLLQADIQQLIELNVKLKKRNQHLLEDNAFLLNLVTNTEERLTPILEQLLLQQQDEPA